MVVDIRDHLAIRRRIAHQPVGSGKPEAKESILGGPYLFIPLEIYISPEEQLRSDAEHKRLKAMDLIDHHVVIVGLRVGLKEFLKRKLIPQLGSRLPPDAPQSKG
jgi:hypothetical protein